MSESVRLRPATLNDLPALLHLEQQCFTEDRISRRQFRWMLKRGHCALIVAEAEAAALAGYILVLFHRGTSLGRIYSLAVNGEMRGLGVAQRLMHAAETAALEQDCLALRLEVRTDNDSAIRLYRKLGYRQFGMYSDYYADHAPALRFQKRILAVRTQAPGVVPWYGQTLPFTCGPASLLMAMKALNPDIQMDRRHELQIWREATSIFMTTGHGGCGPRGLALAAARRGFKVELYINREGPLFIHGVRTELKKEVLELVHQDFKEQVEAAGIPEHDEEISLEALEQALSSGAYALMLISCWSFSRQKSPHWVVITGMDEHYVYLHDPEVDEDEEKTLLDTQNVPVPRSRFWRMARFGKEGLRTAVIISA
ncbi:GNAT family N-acetyltransferase/peptidase C39 family protein [Marinobacterium sediminicola]|uniref:Ribosomal protein S18 acetylase RimI n=1 Tax=Marinobacterium sediminicola TaxID=518898 RepID=A0ABY1RYN6_9GAMM|nr:GNAT family N-acetyltransferase/peptidase C39 family protein [Marinobacterium sediminicola]ULG68056.1 GNAT family N-acetyltransferase/peptidase C39 family protein [Marinobacterium sediminicola]SMR73434.1 Ribosomal protein S18 acetylase RimI [Marinobacterium sediminicola]